MKKKLLKILIYVSIFSMLLTLCSGFASAVDPVSAATMANALAQAITAYGASQGVSMTFDVASTDDIGKGVHELWNEFKDDIQDNNVPTYDSLAVTMWADIYTKVGNNIGININDTEMPYIDAFWNWLLSGPSEMTKVDNEYYEWTLNQNNTVDPINVYTNSFNKLNGYDLALLPNEWKFTSYSVTSNLRTHSIDTAYVFYIKTSDRTFQICVTDSTNRIYVESNTSLNGNRPSSTTNYTYGYFLDSQRYGLNFSDYSRYIYNNQYDNVPYPLYEYNGAINSASSFWTAIETIFGISTDTTISSGSDNISVMPYIGDTVPQNVYIPDNEDVNYAPIPYIGGLDINWDDMLFGDGTGILTNAQKQEIADSIDDDITQSIEKTLTLAADDPDPAPPANEVYIPFLPLQLPNFNFSLSGIWHYVVTWVGTLGSWFTAMFNMWSCLPYAMVVPVYATLVVVIVLGVYRRFLS